MLNTAGVIVVDERGAEDILLEGVRSGWEVFRLPEGIKTKEDFFRGIKKIIPLDPPLYSSYSWDALEDSMWGGIEGIEGGKVIIVWPDSLFLQSYSREDHEMAVNIFNSLTESLADDEVIVERRKQVLVLQII